MRLIALSVSAAAVLLFIGCSNRGHDCDAKAGGACTQDSDCVIATCASNPCEFDCGFGTSYAKSDIAAQKCLVEKGTTAPAECQPSQADINSCGPQPGCAAREGVARCVSGACTTQSPDGGP